MGFYTRLTPDCGVVLTHVGGLYVDVHDGDDAWLSFDAIDGAVDLTIDGPNGIELAPGDYRAVWDDGTVEPFTLACAVEDEPPLEVAGEDPVYAPSMPNAHGTVIGSRISGTATWYCGQGSWRGYWEFRESKSCDNERGGITDDAGTTRDTGDVLGEDEASWCVPRMAGRDQRLGLRVTDLSEPQAISVEARVGANSRAGARRSARVPHLRQPTVYRAYAFVPRDASRQLPRHGCKGPEHHELWEARLSKSEPAFLGRRGPGDARTTSGGSVVSGDRSSVPGISDGGIPDYQGGAAAVGRITGLATWYCGAGSVCTSGYGPLDMVAAIDPTLGIAKGERVRVTHGGKSVVVTVVDVCACAGARIVDLTSGSFLRLAPTSLGVIPVTLEVLAGEGPQPTLPATDMEPVQ